MHAITLFAWLGSHSQTRSTLVVVPYLVIEMSRHAHHSSSSLHLHGCKCMDAGIKPSVFMPCPETAHKNRHDGRRRSGTVLRYMHLESNHCSDTFVSFVSPHVFLPRDCMSCQHCHLRGYDQGTCRRPWHLPHAASISLTRIKYVVCRVQGGCDVIAYPNSSGTARIHTMYPANLSSARLCC